MTPAFSRNPRNLRMVNGVDSVYAADKLRKLNDRHEQWPYPWCYPPPNAKDAMPSGSIPAPAANTQALILQYTVPQGMRFYLVGLIQQIATSGFVEGSGSVIWTVDKDTPIGAPAVQSSPVAWLNNLPFTLGSFNNGPFKLGNPEIFEAGDTIRSKVITDGSITPGAPNIFTTMFWGWTVPAE